MKGGPGALRFCGYPQVTISFICNNPRNPKQQFIIRWSQICLKLIPILHSLAHKRSLSLWQNRLPCYAQKRKGSSSNPLTFSEKSWFRLKSRWFIEWFLGFFSFKNEELRTCFLGSKSSSDMIEGTFSWWRIHRFRWLKVSFFFITQQKPWIVNWVMYAHVWWHAGKIL